MKKLLISILILVGAGAAIAGYLVYDIVRYAGTPLSTIDAPVSFEIPRGRSFAAVARELGETGLVDHPLKLKIIARYTGHDKTIKYGEYLVDPAMSPLDILEQFTAGDVILYRITIPEGFTMIEVAERMESLGFCEKSVFMDLAADPDFVRNLEIPADTLEGYLFPETYLFEKDPSPETIIKTIVGRFKSTFNSEWEDRAKELGFSVHEVVTLASIIEKEAGVPEEREIISSVFHNRLEINMPLAADPTVIYGIEAFDGNITRKHLREKTPYNTYVIRGLPPGPIANPGFESIRAALYPADTDYLFFVAKKDRSHYFSTNYDEHLRAVRKYQLNLN